MAIKYECPKCGRKFTEWGAEKLGFKCPHDAFCPADAPDDIELVRAGSGEDQMPKRSSLKRKPARKAVAAPVAVAHHDVDEDEADEVEVDEPETPDAIEGESDEGEEDGLAEDADDVDDAEEDEDEEEEDDAAPGALPDAEDFDALPPSATPNNPLVSTDEDEWN